MADKALTERHAKLVTELQEHDKRYFQDDAPTVSDAQYDALRRELDEFWTHALTNFRHLTEIAGETATPLPEKD